MARSVTSTNKLKKPIMAAIKSLSHGTRVTLVKDHGGGVFSGHAQSYTSSGAYESLGIYKIKFTFNDDGSIAYVENLGMEPAI